VLSASVDGGIRVWEMGDARLALSFQLDHGVSSVAVMPAETRIVVAGAGGKLRVYDLESRTRLNEFSPHLETVVYVAAIGDAHILSASQEGCFRVWNIGSAGDATEESSFCWPDPPSGLVMACTPAKIAIAGGRHSVVWNFGSTPPLWLPTHSAGVVGLAFLPDGETVLAACADDSCREFEARTGRELRSLPLPAGAAGCTRVTANGSRAVIAGMDNTLRLIDLSNGAEMAAFTADHLITALDCRDDATMCVAGDQSGRLHFLHLREP